MENTVRVALGEILAVEGLAICRDPGRFESLLRGRCETQRKEILWLIGALHEGVVPELLSVKPGESVESCVARLSNRLEVELELRPEAAGWTVESWALSLGLAPQETPSECVIQSPKGAVTDHDPEGDEGQISEGDAPTGDEDSDIEEQDHDDGDDLDTDEEDPHEADLDAQDEDKVVPVRIRTECPRPSCEFVQCVDRAGSVHCSRCGHDYRIDPDGKVTDLGHAVFEVTCGRESCQGVFNWELNEFTHDDGGQECPYCGFWNRDEEETTCPNCEHDFWFEEAGEVTCPECGWRFEVYDDGETNSLSYMIKWTCPHCDILNQSESLDEVACHECKNSFKIDRRGQFDPEIVEWYCEGCGNENKTQDQCRGVCSGCGREVEFEDEAEEDD